MNRLDLITNHKDYIDYLSKIADHEEDRIFCGHDMAHFLEVARIAYIQSLEDGVTLNKELLYAAALLHDIGRFIQYEGGESHEIASGRLCVSILEDCKFTAEEIAEIQAAIVNHRNKDVLESQDLSGYLYRGDKASRACYACHVKDQCNWDISKKNLNIKY